MHNLILNHKLSTKADVRSCLWSWVYQYFLLCERSYNINTNKTD